jgi:hypothetical protein
VSILLILQAKRIIKQEIEPGLMMHSKLKRNEISQFQRIINKFRYGLIFQVIRNKLAETGLVFTPYYLYQEGTDTFKIPELKGNIPEYSIEFLNEEDLKSLGSRARGYSEQEFLSWLRKGKKCLGLKYGGDVAAFMWIHLDEFDFEPINVPLKEDEVYLTDMYTLESYRGNNFAPYLRYRSYEILKKMGKTTIFSVVEFFNTPAMKYKQKLNGKRIRFVLYIRLFKKLRRSIVLKTY